MSSRDEWLRIESRHLAALEAVSQEGSFRGAGESLGYVQSAVSQQIAFLERVVGVCLVERSRGPRAVRLTESGSMLRAHAASIVRRLEAARADVERRSREDAGCARVATVHGSSGQLFARAVAAFRERHPHTDVTATESESGSALLELLGDGDADLALMGVPAAPGPFATEKLLEVPLVLVASRQSPLARLRRPPSVAELSSTPLILAEQPGGGPCFEEWLCDRGGRPQVVCRTHTGTTAQALAGKGLGAAVLPRLVVDRTDPAVAIVDLDARAPTRAIGLVWHSDRGLTGPAAWLGDVMRDVCGTGDGVRHGLD